MTDALENQSQDNLQACLAQLQNLPVTMRLVEERVHKQNPTELQRELDEPHPADVA